MRYKFIDIENESLYKENNVIFVLGRTALFNSLAVDKAKDSCRAKDEFSLNELLEVVSEFGDDLVDNNEQSMTFDDFMDYVKTPPIYGKWFCSVDFHSLEKKQKERLWAYIRKPNSNGLLVVTSNDFKDMKLIRRNDVISRSKVVGLLQLGFPPKTILKDIVIKLFNDRGIEIDDPAANYFILRLSDAYDDYTVTIDTMMIGMNGRTKLDIKLAKELLRDVENYIFDDFMMRLTKPVSSGKIVKNRKVYRMLISMLDSMSAVTLVNKIKRRIDDLILFRLAINKGQIPVTVHYSVAEAKEALGEKHHLYNINDVTFKKLALIASKTSLRDWFFMKMILSNVKSSYDEVENTKALFVLVNRSVISNDRLMNDIGVKDTLKESLYDINSLYYKSLLMEE